MSQRADCRCEVAGQTVELICHCGCKYTARIADINRGWGLSCSKSCAAIKRDFGRPNPRYAENGCPVLMTKKMRAKRKVLRKGRGNQCQKDGVRRGCEENLHPINYGHIFASGDEGHGQN